MKRRLINFFKDVIQRLAKRKSKPQSTVGEDKERWEEWLSDLEASRQDLAKIKEKAAMAARQAGVPNPENVGVLERAGREINTPYSRQLLQRHEAIRAAFVIFDPKIVTPDVLRQQLEEFRSLVEQRQQHYQQLYNRLNLIINLLEQITQPLAWTADLPHQLLFTHPELYQARLALEQLRWEKQQLYIKRLQNSLRNRLSIGESWLEFIKKYITAYAYRLGKRTLQELIEKSSKFENQTVTDLKNLHKRLDPPLLKWNRQALNTITSSNRLLKNSFS